MRERRRSIGAAVLLALLCAIAVLAAGGCGKKTTRGQAIERYSEELREGVSSNVPDEQRKEQMLLLVDQLEALLLRFNQQTVEFVDSYRKLNADYASTRPAFDQLFADYSAERISARTQALDLHFRLASLATAEEWEAIGKSETKLYEKFHAAPPAKEGAK
jgi:hypothetical protein